MSAAVERRHWHFTGSVQGVGFRYRAQYAAQLLDLMDYISNSFLMPFISLLTCIFVGWIIKPSWINEEMEVNGNVFKRKKMYAFMIRYVTPVMMTVLFLQSAGIFTVIRGWFG